MRSYFVKYILGILIVGFSFLILYSSVNQSKSFSFLILYSSVNQSKNLDNQEISVKPLVSIVLTVFNQEEIIGKVVNSILCLTYGPFELIVVYDSCTDRSRSVVEKTIRDWKSAFKKIQNTFRVVEGQPFLLRYIPIVVKDFFEVRSNNIGMKAASGEYFCIIQDDMIMTDFGWNTIILQAFMKYTDLIAVSGRCAHDDILKENHIEWRNQAGNCGHHNYEVHPSAQSEITIRDVAIRGPIIYEAEKMKQMNYFNDNFQPLELDDHDLCLRAAKTKLWRCGVIPVGIKSDLMWSHRRKGKSDPRILNSESKNINLLKENHSDYIEENSILRISETEPRSLEKTNARITQKYFVTGCSSNHFKSMRKLYQSIIIFEPLTKIIIYDLGLTNAQKKDIVSWKIFSFQVFDFSKYPDFFNIEINRGEYAWKPIIIAEVSIKYRGLVLWLDAGNILLRPLDNTWRSIELYGIYSTCSSGTLKDWTHPTSLRFFEVFATDSVLNNTNFNGAIIGLNTLNYQIIAKIILPLYECALKKDCIAPYGSHRLNHRQDQAILSILMAKSGFLCDPYDEKKIEISTHNDDPHDSSFPCFIDGIMQDKC